MLDATSLKVKKNDPHHRRRTGRLPMYVVHILGGLGNQMFQYAFAYAISKEAGSSFKLDINDLEAPDQRNYALDHYCIDVELASLV